MVLHKYIKLLKQQGECVPGITYRLVRTNLRVSPFIFENIKRWQIKKGKQNCHGLYLNKIVASRGFYNCPDSVCS